VEVGGEGGGGLGGKKGQRRALQLWNWGIGREKGGVLHRDSKRVEW